MQSFSSRIWTSVGVSISYDDNHYTTGASFWTILTGNVWPPLYSLRYGKKVQLFSWRMDLELNMHEVGIPLTKLPKTKIRGASISFQPFFFVQEFRIVLDSWNSVCYYCTYYEMTDQLLWFQVQMNSYSSNWNTPTKAWLSQLVDLKMQSGRQDSLENDMQ